MHLKRAPKHFLVPNTRHQSFAAILVVLLLMAGGRIWAQSHAEVLARNGDLSDPANRRQAMAEMKRIEDDRRTAAWARAEAMGWPKRIVLANGAVRELAEMDGDRPIYFTTHNANAAISGANLLRAASLLTGAGFTVGEWMAVRFARIRNLSGA
jgi:hypothetical protein